MDSSLTLLLAHATQIRALCHCQTDPRVVEKFILFSFCLSVRILKIKIKVFQVRITRISFCCFVSVRSD